MIPTGQDSLKTRSTLEAGGKSYAYYSLQKAGAALGDVSRLPFSMKVLLENLLRFEDGVTVTCDDLQCMADWLKERRINREIQYRPARVHVAHSIRRATSFPSRSPKMIAPSRGVAP